MPSASAEPFDLLCFRVGGRRYAITVFKVEGVLPRPRVRRLIGAPPAVAGIARLRDRTVPVIDLAALVHPEAPAGHYESVLLTDCDRNLLAFGIDEIEGILRLTWGDVMRPPRGTGRNALVMGVVRDDHGLVQLLEFEQLIAQVAPLAETALQTDTPPPPADAGHVLVVDDSRLARGRVQAALEQGGWQVTVAGDGEQALSWLNRMDREAPEQLQCLRVVVSDIEMPGLDGYALCRRLRDDSRFRDLKLLLHTSLSGSFDTESVRRCGADDFLSKFDAPELARRVYRLAADEGVDEVPPQAERQLGA
jgi:two-component system chemotaxis response regulator CheV